MMPRTSGAPDDQPGNAARNQQGSHQHPRCAQAQEPIWVCRDHWVSSTCSKQPLELVNTQSGAAHNRPQCATIQLLVIRDNQLCERFVAPKNDVAALTALYVEAPPFGVT
jgi:hypothetical protein